MLRDSEDDWYRSMRNQLEVLANCSLYSSMSKLSTHCTKLQKFLNNSSKSVHKFFVICLSVLV